MTTCRQLSIEDVRQTILDEGNLIERNHGLTVELLSFAFEVKDIDSFEAFRQSEYDVYYEMIENQIDLVRKEHQDNHLSRRLLFQFDRFFYEDKPDDFLICPESFCIFFIDDTNYELLINLRSSDINRLGEDISIIKKIAQEVFPGKSIIKAKVHCYNVHVYV